MQRRRLTSRSLIYQHKQKEHRWEDYEDLVMELTRKGEFITTEDGTRLLSIVQFIRWSSCQHSEVGILLPF